MPTLAIADLTASLIFTNEHNRLITKFMVERGFWSAQIFMRLTWITPIKAIKLFNLMLKYQKTDNLKHAPCCPENHYHRTRLIFQRCTCGANQ